MTNLEQPMPRDDFGDSENQSLGPPLSIGWMLGRHVHAVAEIEATSHPFPMSRAAIRKVNRKFSWITLVAMLDGHCRNERVVGYLSYKKIERGYIVQRLAIHRKHRGMGFGHALLSTVEGKLSAKREVRVRVPETSLSMQTFLRDRGYFVADIERAAWCGEMGPRDCYTFAYGGN